MKRLALVILFLAGIARAEMSVMRPYPTLQELDGSPSIRYPLIKVPNGSLTDGGSFATLTFSAGGGGGSGFRFQNTDTAISTVAVAGDIEYSVTDSSLTLRVNLSTLTTRIEGIGVATSTLKTRIDNLDTSTATLLSLSSATASYLLKGRDRDPWAIVITSGTGWNGLSLPVFTAPRDSAVTIREIRAESLASGTTVLYQLNERAYGTINTSGTDVFSFTSSTATDSGLTTTSFSNAGIAAGASLVFTTPSTGASSGNPVSVKVTIYYTKDNE